MKKSNCIFLFFLIFFPLSLFSQIKDMPSENSSVLNENTPLDCYRCNPKSHHPPLCLNCVMEGKIRLKDNSIFDGKIIAVKGITAQIKIPYGAMDLPIDSIILPEVLPSSPRPSSSPAIRKTLNTLQVSSERPDPSAAHPTQKNSFKKPEFRPEKKALKKSPVSLKNMLKQTHWIAYMPSTYTPETEAKLNPEDIRKDLALLRSANFNGLITYSSNGVMAEIPALAKEAGFEHMIMGVWDLHKETEIENAIKAASLVDGYCIGHEGLFRKEYTKEELFQIMNNVKEKTQKPVTTADNMSIVMNAQNKDLLEACDWIFLIAYFMFDENLKKKTPEKGVKWVQDVERNVDAQLHLKKPLMFKEVGFPSRGELWTDEKNQEKFLRGIVKSNISFALFEAFDQPWKTDSAISPNWGLFKRDRTPKKYAQYRMDRPSVS